MDATNAHTASLLREIIAIRRTRRLCYRNTEAVAIELESDNPDMHTVALELARCLLAEHIDLNSGWDEDRQGPAEGMTDNPPDR